MVLMWDDLSTSPPRPARCRAGSAAHRVDQRRQRLECLADRRLEQCKYFPLQAPPLGGRTGGSRRALTAASFYASRRSVLTRSLLSPASASAAPRRSHTERSELPSSTQPLAWWRALPPGCPNSITRSRPGARPSVVESQEIGVRLRCDAGRIRAGFPRNEPRRGRTTRRARRAVTVQQIGVDVDQILNGTKKAAASIAMVRHFE
jgi:hypothetical protein